MRDKILFFAFMAFVLSTACEDEFFPDALYDYQVERLLSGGEAKTWSKQTMGATCADSTKLYITVSEDDSDSITVYQLPVCDSDDTLKYGNASTSVATDGVSFTDTLWFASEDFWLIESITSTKVEVLRDNVKETYTND